MVDLTLPNFKISRVAKATGVSVNTIRSWYQRKHFTIGMTDKAPGGEGMASFVSARTAIAIGIAGALTNMGISPKRAAHAGLLFAHTGDSDFTTKAKREPGRLWAEGSTLLAISAHEENLAGVQLIHFTDGMSFRHAFNPQLTNQGEIEGAHFLILDQVVDRVRIELGLGRDGEG